MKQHPDCLECKFCVLPNGMKDRVMNSDMKRSVAYCELAAGDKYESCETQRSTGWILSCLFDWCGRAGKYFESKEK